MPARTKTDAADELAVLAPAAAPPKASALCEACGGDYDLHPSTTSWSCEHGTFVFTPAVEAEVKQPTDEERLAAVLASLSTEQLRALLTAKTAAE